MSNGKVMIANLIAGLIKKIWCDFIEISLNAIPLHKNEQIFS